MKSTAINQSAKWLAALLIVGALAACSGHRGSEFRMEKMFDFVAYKLDFTDQQELMLDDIQREITLIREQSSELRKQQHDQMIALFQADELDVVAIEQLIHQRHNTMKEHMPRVMPLVKQLHATLSLEQKQKVVEFVNRHHQDK